MDGKLCIVTGATDGIGRVTARVLAERGAEVLLVGRTADKGAEDLHTAAVVSHDGTVLGTESFSTTRAGYPCHGEVRVRGGENRSRAR